MTLTQQELANVFGVTSRTIRQWRVEGMPAELQDHSGNEYRLLEVLEWYIKRRVGNEFTFEKTRLLSAQAYKTELECRMLKLELLETSEVQNIWATIRNQFQQKVRKVPERVPPSILKTSNLIDTKQQLRQLFAQALEDLAKLKPQTK